jgi:hypothetical protein
MTPERMAELVARWVRFYTRDLPTPIAERRVDEIDADLHDHIAYERANGISDRRIACGIASRMLRGLAADLAWRGGQAKQAQSSTAEEAMKGRKTLYRSALRVALAVALILTLPLVAVLVTDDVAWSPADFVVAGSLLAVIGIAIELVVKKAGNLAAASAIAAVGLAAAIFGKADDAPGLVLLGILLTVSACGVGVRTAQHSR